MDDMNSPRSASAEPSMDRVARAAFVLQASLTVSFIAASSLPTALYPLYQAVWRFTPITVTVVFGIYAFAVLSALLVAGRLSDHVGRRPVLIWATAAQLFAAAVLGTAGGLHALLAARLIQGIATGTAVGAIGAALLDLHREKGTIVNAVAPLAGMAVGSIAGGIMVHFLPMPLRSTYIVLGAVLAMQLAAVVRLPESGSRRAGALASMRPQFRLPVEARQAWPGAASVLVAVWAVAGFVGALGPSLVRHVFHLDASLFGSGALFVLATSGALSVLLLRRSDKSLQLRLGALSLLLGSAVVIAAIWKASTLLYLVGLVVSGVGFGIGFQGALHSIVASAGAHERAAVLSIVYVVCYIAMGLPAILAGYAIVSGYSLLMTSTVYSAVVLLLSAIGLACVRRSKNSKIKPNAIEACEDIIH